MVPDPYRRLAPVYDTLTRLAFGPLLRRASHWTLTNGLPADTGRVLFIGGGTGTELPAVLARCPQARLDFVDASPAMMARARARVAQHCRPADVDRVTFLAGTEADLPTSATYDVVLAFYLLDLFEPAALARVLARMQVAILPGAHWLVTDFAPPRTAWQRGLLAILYRFFGLTTGLRTRRLPDWPAALRTTGLHPLAEASFGPGGLLRAGVWQAAGNA